MVRKAGLAPGVASSAAAFAISQVVDTLTPDSTVPDTLPPDLRIFLPPTAKAVPAEGDRFTNRRIAFMVM